MNKIYKQVWSARSGTYVAVAETAKGRGKSGSQASTVGTMAASLLIAGYAISAGATAANALPTGGQVVAGSAAISTSANTLTVNQSSQRAAINWQSFSIGSGGTVNFVQPNASSVTLNRVVGNEQSVIAGALNANGQVFLLNSSGVLFTGTSSVNVGGIVASTLNQSDADFMAGRTSFERNGSAASVINLGSITTADGGYAALVGNQVSNQGVITARLGTAVLAAGDRVSLNFNGNSLVGVTIDQGTLNALVENQQAIRADGGLVILTAKGLDSVMRTVVNNTGEVRAQTIQNKDGKIYLLGGMESDRIEVGGTLDASAPNGGNGGFVETSAAHVEVADSARVTTLAPKGNNGTWLIDPNDFTVASSGGDMTGAAVGTALAGGNFTIQSSAGATSGNGDIFVRDNVTWTSGNTLTLTADRNIRILATLDASGGSGGVVTLNYGQGAVASGNTATYDFGLSSSGFTGKINLTAGQNFNTKLGSNGTPIAWTVITALGSQGDESSIPAINSLQSLANFGRANGNYVLGTEIDASATASWNSGAGFIPIGQTSSYQGRFDGLGHRIQGLVISASNYNYAGLFAQVAGPNVAINNLGLTKLGGVGSITYTGRRRSAGALVASFASGSRVVIRNVYSELNVQSLPDPANGLYAFTVGGLIGDGGSSAQLQIYNSFSTGNVTGSGSQNGGLIGYVGGYYDNFIRNSYATGNVTGASDVGGLVGYFYGGIFDSYATGAVNSSGNQVGGLVGSIYRGSNPANSLLYRSYATGNVTSTRVGGNYIGGLVGRLEVNASESYATGNVVASNAAAVGGLVGVIFGSTTSVGNSYATGSATGSDQVGGLIGLKGGLVSNSFATGQITYGGGATAVGGLIGSDVGGTTTNSYWDTQTSGMSTSAAGTGKTTAEMKALNLFGTVANPAWDIVGDTAILAGNYPTLRWATSGASAGSSVWVIGTGTGGGGGNGGGSSSGSSSTTDVTTPVANALITPPAFEPPVFTPGLPPQSGSATTPPPNVINPPPVVTAALGSNVPLMLVSAPAPGQPTQGVTLSQALAMLGGGGAAGGDKVVRVPTSRNSMEDIVNGGLNLPDGVEQELFVIQDSGLQQ